MQHVRMKSVEGLWEEKDISGDELTTWFADHTKDGIVCDEIVLFTDAIFKAEGDSVGWVLSDMSLDRDAERVDPAGADLKNYKKNPVVLWAHDSRTPAIGKVLNPRVKDGQLVGKVEFDSKENDPFAGMIAGKVRAGIIQAGSIGFKPNSVEFIEESKDPTRLIHRKWELLEFSICNVPANSNAMVQNSTEADEEKAVIPYANHGKMDEGTAWDGPKQMAACGDDMGMMKAICAWYDSSKPDMKSSYKLPHHMADSKKAVWKGLAAAMGALLGGRGGVDMPSGDRKGVYNHLAKHYAEFEKEPPEFKEFDPVDQRIADLEEKVGELIESMKPSDKKKGYVYDLLTKDKAALEDLLPARSENNSSPEVAAPLDALIGKGT